MSNVYCSIAQLNAFYDIRSLQMLGNDANQRLEQLPILQNALDAAASYIDQFLNGRLSLDPTQPVPMILTGYVADRAMSMLYRRRGSIPKDIATTIEEQDKSLMKIADGTLSLPGLNRSVLPALVKSNSTTGVSQFDNIRDFDQPTSPTAPGGSVY